MTFQGHNICDIEWEGRGVDSFFTAATWEYSVLWGTLTCYRELTNSELDALTDSHEGQDYLCQENMERFHYYAK